MTNINSNSLGEPKFSKCVRNYRNLGYLRIATFLLFVSGWGSVEGLHPVILIPGDGGNQLEAKLDKPTVVHYLCTKKTDDYFNIWLNKELLVPIVIDCWTDNIRLVYNYTTRKTENSPGVQIRVPGFGNTSTVEFLDPSLSSTGNYFKFIVEQSLIPLGYMRDNDIRGAPYDFRKAPSEMTEWLNDFKALVEDSYTRGGNNSVILITHSMGGNIALYFLHQMTQQWKDTYVRSLITLAAPWGGSVKAWKVFAAGDNLGVYVLPAHTLRGQQMTNPSTAFLLPSSRYWNEDEIIVSCPGKGNYSIKDYKRFFDDMNYPVGYAMWEDTRKIMENFTAPGVELHCLYGQGVSTVESMFFKDEKYFPDKPNVNTGNGDGTVNIRSLRGCQDWAPKVHSRKWKKIRLLKKRKNLEELELRKFIKLNKMRKLLGLEKVNWTLTPLKEHGLELEMVEGLGSKNDNELKQKQPVLHQEFPGVDHMQILSDPGVIQYVTKAVKEINHMTKNSKKEHMKKT